MNRLISLARPFAKKIFLSGKIARQTHLIRGRTFFRSQRGEIHEKVTALGEGW